MNRAFQENYSDDFSHCYGCGTLNKNGHQIKSYWQGENTIAHFNPKEYHTAIPGFVYGGLIASLIDCHATGSGAAAIYKQNNNEGNFPRCVTASLHVDYIKPTPIECTLKLQGRIKEIKGRRITVLIDLIAKQEICAKGEVVVVQVPEGWQPK